MGTGEIKSSAIRIDKPIQITCLSTETEKRTLKAEVYALSYQ